ncbi:MAG: POTRA domain-containing protein [Alphaproteobacteria bacterium]
MRLFFTVLAGICFTALPLGAQQSAEPGQIERQIEQSKPSLRPAETEIRLLPDQPVRTAGPTDDRFVLAAVVLDGATVFDPVDFAPYYEDLLAREITLADIENILARITKKYRDEGYVLSRAIAPPQNLAAGVVRITVIEGYVDQIIYEGQDFPQDAVDIYARRIKAERPLRLEALERSILLINNTAGLRVEPRLRAIDADNGRYAVVLRTTHTPVDGFAFVDNRGTPAVGRAQGWASVGLNGLLGWRERFQFGMFTVPTQPSELMYLEGSFTQAVGDDGLSYALQLSQTAVDPGSEQNILGVESAATHAQFRLRYPLILASKQNLWVKGAFDYQDSVQTAFDRTTSDDRQRVFRAGFDYWLTHGSGSTNLTAQVSQGLNILDATEQGSRNLSLADGRSDFTKLTGNITRQQALFGNVGLQAQVGGQWSAQPLLAGEEMGLGGTQYGRAYDFSEVTGDSAVAGSLELHYTANTGMKWLSAYQAYTFYDLGSVWNDVAGDGTTRDSVSSVGGGARFIITPQFRINLEIAKPLTREVNTRDSTGTRAFLNVTAIF